eukprot:4238900-Prymnesium_polylepis.1
MAVCPLIWQCAPSYGSVPPHMAGLLTAARGRGGAAEGGDGREGRHTADAAAWLGGGVGDVCTDVDVPAARRSPTDAGPRGVGARASLPGESAPARARAAGAERAGAVHAHVPRGSAGRSAAAFVPMPLPGGAHSGAACKAGPGADVGLWRLAVS